MATVTRMNEQEHKEIFQTISESIVAEPEAPKKNEEVDPRALRGALYLDEHHPGWAHKMDLETFNITIVTDCVVGQLAGNYWDGARRLFQIPSGSDVKAKELGIMPLLGEDENSLLNRSWKILIQERQVCAEANSTSA